MPAMLGLDHLCILWLNLLSGCGYQIQGHITRRCEWGQRSGLSWVEVHTDVVTGKLAAAGADLSQSCLWVKPACTLLISRVQVSHCLPVSPSNHPTSQAGLPPLCKIPGWKHPICGSQSSFPRVCLHHVLSHFLWVLSQGHGSWPDHFSFLPTQLCVDLSYSLDYTTLSASFHWKLFHM